MNWLLLWPGKAARSGTYSSDSFSSSNVTDDR